MGKYLWPEIEANATYFLGGKTMADRKTLSPPASPPADLEFAPEMNEVALELRSEREVQIATSQFHSYNHQLLFTSRFIF